MAPRCTRRQLRVRLRVPGGISVYRSGYGGQDVSEHGGRDHGPLCSRPFRRTPVVCDASPR